VFCTGCARPTGGGRDDQRLTQCRAATRDRARSGPIQGCRPGLSLEGVIFRTSDQEKTRIPPRTHRAKLGGMPELSPTSFRSGDALFAFGPELTVISWNRAAEELTGISAEQALGRQCWEVLGGEDEGGNLVCHQGCSTARLVREGWPVSCQGLLIKARGGRRQVDVATVAVDDGERRTFLHVMVFRRSRSPPGTELLTPRQQEVLRSLADGIPAKVIAACLEIAETTVRNHIHAILVALGTHSQLEAIAKARHLQLIE
jgi:PAS domain S-box-containing protein